MNWRSVRGGLLEIGQFKAKFMKKRRLNEQCQYMSTGLLLSTQKATLLQKPSKASFYQIQIPPKFI